MKEKFEIEFIARESNVYSVTVEAETPEEAKKLFDEAPGDYDWELGDSADEPSDITNVEVIGKWIDNSLKRI